MPLNALSFILKTSKRKHYASPAHKFITFVTKLFMPYSHNFLARAADIRTDTEHIKEIPRKRLVFELLEIKI
jgi:hypothetical protein